MNYTTTYNAKGEKEMIVEVTEEDVKLGKTKRKPGTYVIKRGRKVDKESLEPKNIKVRITLYVDLDVLNYFKARAEEPNAAPYQTQINNELRAVMEGKRTKQRVSLSSKQIEQIADRVATRLKEDAPKRKRKKAA
jgi:uncharacterized protein (DUF4415 family)